MQHLKRCTKKKRKWTGRMHSAGTKMIHCINREIKVATKNTGFLKMLWKKKFNLYNFAYFQGPPTGPVETMRALNLTSQSPFILHPWTYMKHPKTGHSPKALHSKAATEESEFHSICYQYQYLCNMKIWRRADQLAFITTTICGWLTLRSYTQQWPQRGRDLGYSDWCSSLWSWLL